jgi:hypothetical protein
MPTSSAVASPQARDDVRTATAEVFAVFQRLFGRRWADTAGDGHARPAWLAAFRHAGLNVQDIKRGLAAASGLTWPPSCGEFIELCRPPAPTVAAALAEAVRWVHGQVGEWSHPAVGAAARDVGSWQLRHGTERELLATFGAAYRQMVDRHRRGDPLDVPTIRALPREVHRSVPRGAEPPAVRQAIAMASALLGVSHD